ncbi:hypothetical protein LZC95_09350 [Pendulispora brunnea]|uniref:Uncharacterized protein n=1 Tax=Pendulispora brunnea TaxID=2905690 RepID=A0ABZ2KG44_9BACT
MFPSSSVASPIFAAIWSLVYLGAMRTYQDCLLPFGPVWGRHAQDSLPAINRVRDLLHEKCGFSPDIAEMLLDDWKLRDRRIEPRHRGDLDVLVESALGRLGTPLPTTEQAREQRVNIAAHRQFALLLDAMFAAERAAEMEGVKLDGAVVREVLWTVRGLAGTPPLYEVESKEALLKTVISEWRAISDWRTSRPPELDEWIAKRMNQSSM